MKTFKTFLKEGLERVARLGGAIEMRQQNNPNFGNSPEDLKLINAHKRAVAKLQRRQFNASPASWDMSNLHFQTKLRFGQVNRELLDRHYNDLIHHGLSGIYLDNPIDGTPTQYTMADVLNSLRNKRPLRPKHGFRISPRSNRRRPPPEDFI